MNFDKGSQTANARPDITRSLKTQLLKLFPCLVRINRAEELRRARILVKRSRIDVDDWTDYLEFKVFPDVQGDDLTPDTIHGQHLVVHFSESVYREKRAVCSDSKGRWFELTGEPGESASLRRMNAKKATEELRNFQALVQLADTAHLKR